MTHDNSYKLLFSHPEMVRDLLLGFVKEDWVEHCDFSSLEKVSGSYVSDDIRDREDDAIWRIRWGEDWLYVYLLLEFQSTDDHFMAVRILGYLALLYQDLIRTGKFTRHSQLPPVLPIVLYNGRPRWQAPVSLDDLIQSAPGMLQVYRPQLRYLLLDEGLYQDAELSETQNLVSALFQLENSRSTEDIQAVLERLIDWLKNPSQTSLRRAFTVWMSRVLLPAKAPKVQLPPLNDLHEVQTMLAERFKQWAEDWKEQGLREGRERGRQQGLYEGRQEGRQEGIQQGEAETLLKLFKLKFGEVPDWAVKKILEADKAQLDCWVELILTADSVESLLG
jgi:predicted transposase/invertase (TIGR01784 family)